MALKVASRGTIPSFIVMDVMRAANAKQAAGDQVLHMEVGQPGTPAPQAVRRAAQVALENDLLGYTDAFGLPALRGKLQQHYLDSYGVTLSRDRIAVTPGSSGAFLLGFLAAFDPGDRVALAAPGYPAYRNILTALGLEVVSLETTVEQRYQPTPDLLAKAGKLDGLIVASPSNPTGTMLDGPSLKALVDYCEAEGIRLVSDEIYHGIAYGPRAVSAAEFTDKAIIINSFSKYFCMTGWRLGWMVLPEDLVRPVECLSQNFFISASALSQQAALAAFDCADELDAYVTTYAQNRELLLRELPRAGFDKLAPADGAFYLYAEVGHLTNDSPDFCQRMLKETSVAVTPGTDFDPERGHQTLRFSFAGPTADMAEAAERLGHWLKRG